MATPHLVFGGKGTLRSGFHSHRCMHQRLCLSFKATGRLSDSASSSQAAKDESSRKPQTVRETEGRRTRHYDAGSGDVISDSGNAGDVSIQTNLIDFGKGLVLPRGYPLSVSDDYVPYQLWAFPCHVFGWASNSLATSSLLKAVGVDLGGAAGAVGATAAVKWITKDGIGAFGRLLVGSKLGPVFDEDPKRWRMLSEVLGTGGMALELSTAFAPSSAFLWLAGLGNLALAAGRGMGKPCFRIIQTHFAVANNNGDVAAKEEVWEVGAQLIGLAASVAILNAVQASGDPYNVLWAWCVCQAAHITCRYKALSVLRLKSINHKRGGIIVNAHVAGLPLPDPGEAGLAEARVMWLSTSAVSPRLELGCSLESLLQTAPTRDKGSRWIGSDPRSNADNHSEADPPTGALAALVEVYDGSDYMLTWQGGSGKAILREGAPATAALQALWQAAHLEASGIQDTSAAQLSGSLTASQQAMPQVLLQAEAAGWDTNNLPIRSGPCRFALD